MAEGSVECANCGRANPAWAQVCRSCGAPMRGGSASEAPQGETAGSAAFVDQGSLLAIGAALGTILVAIVLGVVAAGVLPPAPPIAVETASPVPSATAEQSTPGPTVDPSATADPSAGAPLPTPTPGPPLPGTLTFGLGLNQETQRVTNPTDTFTPGTVFAHSIELTAPFGVNQIRESVAKVNQDGSETLLIPADEHNQLPIPDPDATVKGFFTDTNDLLDPLGPGTFVLRVYRGSELLAQGRFILSE